MSPNMQFILSFSIPSVLVILSWINNNTRLESRMKTGLDGLNKRVDETKKRMDDKLRGFHNDMMGFQASVLEAVFQLRERVTAIDAKLNN